MAIIQLEIFISIILFIALVYFFQQGDESDFSILLLQNEHKDDQTDQVDIELSAKIEQRSNHSQATTSEFPKKNKSILWEIPTRDNPEVLSEFGDWKWVYPTDHTKTRDAYMNFRFMEHEIEKDCRGICCVGATGNGGGQVRASPKCVEHMDLMVEFRPTNNRKQLYSLVDAIVLYRTKHPEKNMSMMFVGDSVTGQLFHGAVCELARNPHVEEVIYAGSGEDFHLYTDSDWRTTIVLFEAKVKLRSDPPNRITTIFFIREFRIPLFEEALNVFFSPFDIIIIGWGLHYEVDNEYGFHLEKVFRSLNKTKEQTLLWFGAPRQHFRFFEKDIDTAGLFHYRNKNDQYQFCGNAIRYPFNHDKFDPRNQYAYRKAISMGLEATWINWTELDDGKCNMHLPNKTTPHLYFLPMGELTSPFYKNHEDYKPDITVEQGDCTHSCWTPNLYEPFWDALFLSLKADGVCNNNDNLSPKYPSHASAGASVNIILQPKFTRLDLKMTTHTRVDFLSPQIGAILKANFGPDKRPNQLRR